MTAAVSSARRASLLALKLQALVRDAVGAGSILPSPFHGGAALLRDGEAWILLEDDPGRGLGGALAWADRQGTATVHVVADADTGLLARRAAFFGPAPRVWAVDGRSLELASTTARPAAPPLPPAVAALRGLIEGTGAEAVEEHGVLAGEVAGLEVCRVVLDESGAARLDVGIGAHDREAFRLVHGDGPVAPALAAVVAQVTAHRRPGGPDHALNRLARERALRWRLCGQPDLLGLATLTSAPPPVPRANVSDAVPCAALGTTVEGETVVVVCSAGVDLDLVPFAADARDALAGPAARLLLAVPAGDDHPVTRRLAERLAVPAEVVPIRSPSSDT